MQRYGRVLDLEGASRGGSKYKYTAKKETGGCLPSVKAERRKNGMWNVKERFKKNRPLDDVERAERAVLWRETVERGVERDADVVDSLSEDWGDVAE